MTDTLDRMDKDDPDYAGKQFRAWQAAHGEAWAELCPDLDPEHVPSACATAILIYRAVKRIEAAPASRTVTIAFEGLDQ